MTSLKNLLLLGACLTAALVSVPQRSAAAPPPCTVPPIFDCCADSFLDPTGPEGREIVYFVGAVDCYAFPVETTCSPPSGSIFPIGTTTVSCTATDDYGNTSNLLFTVTIWAPRQLKTQVRDDLIALRGSATSDISKFTAAINYLNKSIDSARWPVDDSHPKPGKAGEEVFTNEKSAVSQMVSLRAKYPAVQELIDKLVDTDRLIAEIALAEAIDRNGNPSKIQAAQNYLNKGDTDAANTRPTNAIDDYKNAWKNAIGA